MIKESPIVIKNREELILLLSEVSLLEDMLMCEYLFASFSLKRDTCEGVIVSQLQAIRRWEGAISGVAVQEMLQTSSRY
jgi:hypothetical protein